MSVFRFPILKDSRGHRARIKKGWYGVLEEFGLQQQSDSLLCVKSAMNHQQFRYKISTEW